MPSPLPTGRQAVPLPWGEGLATEDMIGDTGERCGEDDFDRPDDGGPWGG